MSNTRTRLQRIVSGGAVAAVVGATALAAAAPASATSDFKATRLSGTDRFATANSVALATFPSGSSAAILVNGTNGHFPDALAGNYLAGVLNAPVLLTTAGTTPAWTLAALSTLKTKDVWVIGGTSAVTDAQYTALAAKGYTMHRLGGADRYATDAAVIANASATAVGSIGGVKTAIMATGVNFPDALAAGPLSYAKNVPLFLVNGTQSSLPGSVTDELVTLGISQVVIAGGSTVVSAGIERQLDGMGITVAREGGTGRSQTSQLIAEYEIANAGFIDTTFDVASGYPAGGGADALAGGPHAGGLAAPMLITHSNISAGSVDDFAKARASTESSATILGGPVAISDAVVSAITAAAQTTSTSQVYAMTPSAPITKSVSANGDHAGVVTYTTTGLGTTPVDIALIKPSDIPTNGSGGTTFLAGHTAGQAALTPSDVGSIVSVNGTANTGTTATNVQPANGQITFSVDSSDAGTAVPVVFSNADNDNALDLGGTASGAYGAPNEAFGVGGTVTWTAPTVATGSYTGETVSAVDATAKTFQAGGGTPAGPFTFSYGVAGSTYNYAAAGNGSTSLTLDQFESYLSAGDTVDVDYHAAGPSTFTITADQPAAPTDVSAATTKASSSSTMDDAVQVSWSAVSNPDVTGYRILRATVTNGTVGTFAALTSVGSAATSYVDTTVTAGGSYQYEVKAVAPNSLASDASPPTATVTLPQTPGAVPGAAPINVADLTTDAPSPAIVDEGDVWTLVFNEPVRATGKVDVAFTLKDADGTVTTVSVPPADVDLTGTTYRSGTYLAGQVAVVKTLDALFDTPSGGDNIEEYPATILGVSGLVDVDENLAVNTSGSADKTLG